jgi:hypothetical protein
LLITSHSPFPSLLGAIDATDAALKDYELRAVCLTSADCARSRQGRSDNQRHSQITLTMDPYGHLFPGQATEAVGRFGHMLTSK